MSRGLETVESWMAENEWSPEAMDNPYSCWDQYEGANGVIKCFFQILPDLEQFLFTAVPLDLDCPKERRAEVGELVLRLNHGMCIGSFGLDFDEGTINFRGSMNYYECEFTSQSISNIVGSALEAVELYLPAFEEVIAKRLSPQQAIAEIDRPNEEDEGE